MEIIIVLVIVLSLGLFAIKYMNQRSEKCEPCEPSQSSQLVEGESNQREQVRETETADVNADLYDNAKEKLESINTNMESKDMEEKKGTRDLFLETLTKIGCQYEIDEDDINFAYQGEYFVTNCSNGNHFIHFYDTNWAHVELYDIDEFSRLKKAINESNIWNSVTTVYTIDEAGSNVNVHCKSVVLFIPEIPEIADYLRLELNEFFKAHEFIKIEMAKQREQDSCKQ